jgi:hypothetical protein
MFHHPLDRRGVGIVVSTDRSLRSFAKRLPGDPADFGVSSSSNKVPADMVCLAYLASSSCSSNVVHVESLLSLVPATDRCAVNVGMFAGIGGSGGISLDCTSAGVLPVGCE